MAPRVAVATIPSEGNGVSSFYGGSGTTWAEASSVANDMVLEQEQTIYDGDGNAIETIDRQRFDNATGTGPLGTPTSGIGARVYYTAEYYDNADRKSGVSSFFALFFHLLILSGLALLCNQAAWKVAQLQRLRLS